MHVPNYELYLSWKGLKILSSIENDRSAVIDSSVIPTVFHSSGYIFCFVLIKSITPIYINL